MVSSRECRTCLYLSAGEHTITDAQIHDRDLQWLQQADSESSHTHSCSMTTPFLSVKGVACKTNTPFCHFTFPAHNSPGCRGHSALPGGGLRDWAGSGHEEENLLPL